MAKIDELNESIANLQTTADVVVAKIDELKQGASALDPQLDAAKAAVDEAVGKLQQAIS